MRASIPVTKSGSRPATEPASQPASLSASHPVTSHQPCRTHTCCASAGTLCLAAECLWCRLRARARLSHAASRYINPHRSFLSCARAPRRQPPTANRQALSPPAPTAQFFVALHPRSRRTLTLSTGTSPHARTRTHVPATATTGPLFQALPLPHAPTEPPPRMRRCIATRLPCNSTPHPLHRKSMGGRSAE